MSTFALQSTELTGRADAHVHQQSPRVFHRRTQCLPRRSDAIVDAGTGGADLGAELLAHDIVHSDEAILALGRECKVGIERRARLISHVSENYRIWVDVDESRPFTWLVPSHEMGGVELVGEYCKPRSVSTSV